MTVGLELFSSDDRLRLVDVAIHAKTKHPILWPLAVKMGGVISLAKEIPFRASSVYRWVSLKDYPKYGRRNKDKRQVIESGLFKLTQKLLDDLWPQSLKDAIDAKYAAQETTQLAQMDMVALGQLEAQRRELPPVGHEMISDEMSEILNRELKLLRPRDRQFVEMRFGLNGHSSHTFAELGDHFGVSATRSMDIVNRAIYKIGFKISDFMYD